MSEDTGGLGGRGGSVDAGPNGNGGKAGPVDTTAIPPDAGPGTGTGTGKPRGPYKPRAGGGDAGSAARTAGAARTAPKEKVSRSVDLSGLEALLLGVHSGISAMLKSDVWELEEEEAKSLAVAASRVAAHYDMGGSQKMIDWGMLLTTLGSVYGTRIMAASIDSKTKRKEQTQNGIQLVPAATGM